MTAVAKTLVRVTQEPNVVREVDDAVFLDLSRQGLIYSHNRGDGTSPEKWAAKKKNEEVVEQAPEIAPTTSETSTDTKEA